MSLEEGGKNMESENMKKTRKHMRIRSRKVKKRNMFHVLKLSASTHLLPSSSFTTTHTCENTHHELDVVKSIGQQVVLILDQADGVEPLTHGLQRAAGTYEGVEGQTLQ